MIEIYKDQSLMSRDIPFGILDVQYPDRSAWDLAGFAAMRDQELAAIKSQAEIYDRKAEFSEDPYFRYFRKHKKTYPVMAQLESFLLKDRPFPEYNPINQVAFLTELKTRMLTGTHDADKIEGALVLFEAAEEISFVGMGGRDKHSYKGDLTGRDDGGVILTMISGPDEKTCLTEETRHPVYMVFAPEGLAAAQVEDCLNQMEFYIKTLAPRAEIVRRIV
ncbi:hypothetical protein [Emergencia timonensis]|uniref:hypothetical protein n=1 Tax=Emergencia timonensis TaxID=1776384 RepID=UPI003993188D